jgi:DNA-binding NtrC family response regulator
MENLNVILVDDEEEFVSALAERLRMRGLTTRTANNGEEALQLIAAEPPQVVVLDLIMPGMSGLQVLKRVRADYPEIQVILLTGVGATKDGVEGMRLGAFDYLMKPLHIEALIEKIGEAARTPTEGTK